MDHGATLLLLTPRSMMVRLTFVADDKQIHRRTIDSTQFAIAIEGQAHPSTMMHIVQTKQHVLCSTKCRPNAINVCHCPVVR